MTGPGEFARLPHQRAKGDAGEADAARELERRGYRILARNVRNHAGEIDLVAADGATLCFVEIKARLGDRFGPAIAAIGAAKQRRLARAAALYLVSHPWSGPCRFDVLGMDAAESGWRFTLVKSAFEVPSTS